MKKLILLGFFLVAGTVAAEENIYERLDRIEKRLDDLESTAIRISTEPIKIPMPIGYQLNSFDRTPYKCYLCGKTFRQFRTGVSCAVLHGPGSCCHYNSEEVEK